MGCAGPHWHMPPRGTPTPPTDEPPSLSATAHGLGRFNARTVTGRKYHCWRTDIGGWDCLISPCGMGRDRSPFLASAHLAISGRGGWGRGVPVALPVRRNVPGCFVIQLSSCGRGGAKKSSSHISGDLRPKSKGVQRNFLIIFSIRRKPWAILSPTVVLLTPSALAISALLSPRK